MKYGPLLVATSNSGKLREIRTLLGNLPVTLLSFADFPNIEAVAETGSTFAENATLKASGYARQAHVPTLADDSGLSVDALNGAPGVHSARYLGEQASYADRIRALLIELEDAGKDTRTARFICALAVAAANGSIIYRTQAICEGRIADAPVGDGGFGYDPIFLPDGFNQTFGELPADVKNRISHRGRALAEAHQYIASLTGSFTAR